MNVRVMTLSIMLILGIGIPNAFASNNIAALNAGGNMTITPTPTPTPTPTLAPTPTITPNPSITAPLDLSEADTNDGIIVNETMPTIQQLASNNPNMSSIIVNFSSTSEIEAEYDEEEQQLSIEITEGEPTGESAEETEPEETEELGDEEEEDDGNDNDNGINSGNGNGNSDDNDNGNDVPPGIRLLPELPDIDLNLPRGFFD